MSERIIENFQKAILAAAATRLGRALSPQEMEFISQHQGLLALEMIKDSVESLSAEALTRYLNSR